VQQKGAPMFDGKVRKRRSLGHPPTVLNRIERVGIFGHRLTVPAGRLGSFLWFLTDRGERRAMEVIWGNRLKPGDYKYIGGFPHFVADAGEYRIGRWLYEKIDLAGVYAEVWKDAAPVASDRHRRVLRQ
jgi:hypothetical protein